MNRAEDDRRQPNPQVDSHKSPIKHAEFFLERASFNAKPFWTVGP